jgi:hypothetical protein
LVGALNVRLLEATLLLTDGAVSAAASILGETRGRLEFLAGAEPSSRVFARALATAWRLEAGLRLATGRADAGQGIARALDLGEPLVTRPNPDKADVGDFAQSCILAGRIALAQGGADDASRHWHRALEVLNPHLAGSTDWRFLDPAAQAFVLTGGAERARPLIEQLRLFGYHPTDPLAASTLGLAVSPATSNPNK